MFELILVFLIVAALVCELLTAKQSREQVEAGNKTKIATYKQTMLLLWLPTIFLIVAILKGEISVEGWGLSPQLDSGFFAGAALLTLVSAYFAFSLRSIRGSEKLKSESKKQLADMAWILPNSSNERYWFIFGVSVAAGICEELLFRGFLLSFLQPMVGTTLAVIVSSVTFGLFHLYQGWSNVLRTGLVGLVLAIIYLLTGSIWIVIVLHFLLDAYAGQLSYLVNNQ
ncbi:CPBP family intramembrane metalloprotease [Pseudoalteromonas sp. CnMc7-15]|uniref:CPBP family intramembrane glutamic endopeptidase n=1 Tax=unclassified Pseudoalteromonas TaxID=194690 RepID=UPI001EF6CE0C|nr:CPBP family intramembrane glutamic endopeptidase [Pseudoalteromonas sp. CnMc7-15]MCG7565398.1 CPBP family intramembrane metalloprotease [Pseudoalteromonas sp. CnMc7-15]